MNCFLMTDKSVEEVIKHIVLANADNDIKSIAVVFVNAENEPEMQIGLAHYDAYRIISGLEILKQHLINNLIINAAKTPKDRQ